MTKKIASRVHITCRETPVLVIGDRSLLPHSGKTLLSVVRPKSKELRVKRLARKVIRID